MSIYLAFHWCDGFGNDGYLWGVYSSLEKALEDVKDEPEEKYVDVIKIIKTKLDKTDNEYVYCELEYYYPTWDKNGNYISEELD